MSKVVVALYDNFEHARMAVEELVNNGFRRDDISLIASDDKGDFKRYLDTHGEETEDVGEGAAAGAGIGAVLGGISGLLVGLGVLAIPGIGPVLAAGPLVSALAGAGIGAAAGGLLGALTQVGVPEEHAQTYVEGVRRGNVLVTITAADDRANEAVNILNRHNPIDVDRRSAEWRSQPERIEQSGTVEKSYGSTTGGTLGTPERPIGSTPEDVHDTGFQTEHRTGTGFDTDLRRELREGESETLPVIEEELRVGKREIEEGGKRIRTEIEETPVHEDVTLRKERVEVERRPVDRPVDPADLDTFREGTIEMTERSEEAVVDKRARVVEEVEIRKDVEHHTESIDDSVRRTDVHVEDMGSRDTGWTGTGMASFDDYDDAFRSHYNTNYANTSFTYDQYRPYYQYGYQLASDERYRNRSWDEIEMDARRDWERQHPDSLWDEFKMAVREGWDAIRGRR